MEDHQDSAAQQALQKAHAVHHADWDHPGGAARSDDSVPATEARLWHQGPGVFFCVQSVAMLEQEEETWQGGSGVWQAWVCTSEAPICISIFM